MSLLPKIGPKTTWSLSVGETDYELRNLRSSQFERFVAEYIEHGIRSDDFKAFAYRWLEPDAGESLYIDGEKAYPFEEGELR